MAALCTLCLDPEQGACGQGETDKQATSSQSFFSLLGITNPASELAFLTPNSLVPGALAMAGLFSHLTTMYLGEVKIYIH